MQDGPTVCKLFQQNYQESNAYIVWQYCKSGVQKEDLFWLLIKRIKY